MNPMKLGSKESRLTISDYAFGNKTLLPRGWWALTVLTGNAWVYTSSGNKIVHEGESVEIFNPDQSVSISSLYARGVASFELASL